MLILYFNSWKLHEFEVPLLLIGVSLLVHVQMDIADYIPVTEWWVLQLSAVILNTLFSAFK